jgi:hypothetical protein
MPPLNKKTYVLALTLVAGAACRSGGARPPLDAHAAWANAPLSPTITFAELVPPRSVRLLVLDAHSGAPLDGAQATLGPSNLSAVADQFGRALIPRAALGRQRLLVRRPGYQFWSDSVTISDTAGLALVVQLRRSSATFFDPAVGSKPP